MLYIRNVDESVEERMNVEEGVNDANDLFVSL